MGKKKFIAIALDSESETFVVYNMSLSSDVLPSFSLLELNVYSFRRSQVSALIAEEALTKVSAKYSDFADVFFSDLASKLLKHTGINNHVIELINGQQSPYGPIYNLESVELKAYIETNLANGFIKPSQSFVNASIFFDQKSNSSLRLCVNYWGLNKLTIKNRFPLSLIRELLDRLKIAKRFT